MAGRKRMDPKMVLYNLDVSYRRAVLGAPGIPKKHLPKMLERIKHNNVDLLAEVINSIRNYLGDEFKQLEVELNLQNDEWVSLLFKMASKLDEQDFASDRAIATAFKAANLDVHNPLNWRVLMERFCWAHFGEKGKPGAGVFWTDEKYCELLRQIDQVKTEKGLTTDRAACDEILKRFSKDYRTVSSVRIRRALREARDANSQVATCHTSI